MLEYFERRVERLEQRFRAFKATKLEDVHEGSKRFKEQHPEFGVVPIERHLEQLITVLRNKLRKALYCARVERDAELLKMTMREEVHSLCSQSAIQAHDFIKLPPPLILEDVPELSEEERARLPEIYRRRIWWMIADIYPED